MGEKLGSPRRFTRRELLSLAALSGLGLIAAGCAKQAGGTPEAGTGAQAPTAPVPAAGGKVQVRLVVMDYDENMKPDTQALLDAFNQSQDKIEAKLDVYSWGQGHDLLLTQISGNQAPDLANGNSQWLGEWVGINEVLPLDDVLGKEFLGQFVASGIKAFTIKGKLMAVPYFLDPRAMYYRKDLFEKEGLNPPKTWQDVIAAAVKLHKPPDMTGFGLTFARQSDDLDYFWYAWLGANGAGKNVSLWTEDGHSRLASPEAIEAVQFLADLVQKHKVTNADVATAGRDEALQPLFYAGRLAMLETGSWFPTLLKKNAPDVAYGIEAIPVAEAGMTSMTAFWPDCVMMFKQSKHPQEAATLLQSMYTKENRLLFAKQRGVIPERTDVGQDAAYAVSDVEKFFVAQLATAVNSYESPWPATIYQIYVQAETLIGRAVIGELPVEDAMKQAAAFADKTNNLS